MEPKFWGLEDRAGGVAGNLGQVWVSWGLEGQAKGMRLCPGLLILPSVCAL